MPAVSLCPFRLARRLLVFAALVAALAATGCTTSNSSAGSSAPAAPAFGAQVTTLTPITPNEMGAMYQIVVSNTGNAATTGTVTVTDPPTGFTPTAVAGTGWTCMPVPAVNCSRTDTLAAGASYPPIVVTGNLSLGAGQVLSIQVAISGGGAAAANPAATSSPVVQPLTIGEAFNPTASNLNGTTAMTFTLTNPAANTVAETGAAFSDTLAGGLQVASPNGLVNNCSGTPTAVAGATTISLAGGTVGVNTNCTLTVNVTGTATGTSISNTSGAVSSTNGGTGAVSNTATLSVAAAPKISKQFAPASIPLNTGSVLSFTVTNPVANAFGLTGVGFSDTLPAGMVIATPSALAGTCGTATPTAVAGSSVVSLAAGTLAQSGSCTFTVNVTGTTAGSKTNTTGVSSSTQSGVGTASTEGSATLTVVAPPTISKNFGASSILTSGTTSLTFTLGNPNASQSLSGISFTDTLPPGLVVATPSALMNNTCNVTPTATAGSGSVTIGGATLAASAGCGFSVNVNGTTPGTKNNVTTNVVSTEGGTGGTGSATLTVGGNTATTISSVVVNPSSILGGSFLAGTVTLNGPAQSGGQPVTLTSQNTAIVTVPASVTVAAGATTANFVVTTLPITTGSPISTTVTGAAFGGMQQGTVWVTPPDSLTSVRLSAASVIGGIGSSLSATLDTTVPTGGITVGVSSSNPGVANPVTSTISITSGTTGSVVIGTSAVAGVTPVTINVTLNNQTLSTTLTVNPTGSVVISNLAFNFPNIVGGGANPAAGVIGTLTLNSAPTSNTVVALSSSNTSAVVPASATVLSGQTTVQFPVMTSAVLLNGTEAVISATLNNQTTSTALTLNLPLAITTVVLPLGEAGQPYIGATLARSGGGNGTLTWSLANASVLPSPLGLASTGVISGTPGTPTSSPTPMFTVQVADPQGNTAQATLSLRVDAVPSPGVNACGSPLGNESLLNGHYALVGRGYIGGSSTTPIVEDGSFNALGTGIIGSGGVLYLNTPTAAGGFQTYTVTGGYYTLGTSSNGTQNLGCIQLNISDGTTTSAGIGHFAMSNVLNGSNVATHGDFVEFDNYTGTGSNISGEFRLQDASDFSLAALGSSSVRYAFGTEGVDFSGGHFGEAGSFNVVTTGGTAGTLNNVSFDFDDAGSVNSVTAGTGSIPTSGAGSIDANGTLLVTFNLPASLGGGTSTSRMVIVNKNELFMIGAGAVNSNTSPPIFMGRAIVTANTYTNASVAGSYIVTITGIDASGSNSVPGCTNTAPCSDLDLLQVNFNSGTLQVTGTQYEEEGGFVIGGSITSSGATTYAVDLSTGRIALTSTSQNGSAPVLYSATPVLTGTDLTDPFAAFLVGAGTGPNADTSGTFGVAELQSTPGAYSNASLISPPLYLLATADVATAATNYTIGTGSFLTAGTFTGTQDVSSPTGGLTPGVTGSTGRSFVINSDGTGIGAGGNSLSIEVTNGTDLYFGIPNNTSGFTRSLTQ